MWNLRVSRSGTAHRLQTHTGFTLLEVMVALMVIAFAFVGLLGLHGRNIKTIARDQQLTRARGHAHRPQRSLPRPHQHLIGINT